MPELIFYTEVLEGEIIQIIPKKEMRDYAIGEITNCTDDFSVINVREYPRKKFLIFDLSKSLVLFSKEKLEVGQKVRVELIHKNTYELI